jgi:hypothetical protein
MFWLFSGYKTEYLIYRLKNILIAKDPDGLETDGIVLDLVQKTFNLTDQKTAAYRYLVFFQDAGGTCYDAGLFIFSMKRRIILCREQTS